MPIANSPAPAGAARQRTEQIAAAGNTDQGEYPSPKATRLGVECGQWQHIVETRERLVHDRASYLDGSAPLRGRHAHEYGPVLPFEFDIADDGRAKGVGSTALRA